MLLKFIELKEQLRICHWQTTTYARHIAFGDTYSTLDDLIDSFIEAYSGKNDCRLQIPEGQTVGLFNLGAFNLDDFIQDNIDWLASFEDELLKSTDTALLNIRDEMLQALHRLQYLLTLK